MAALRPGGRAVVFDKFAPPTGASGPRRVLNVATSRLGTDITRAVEPMLDGADATVAHDEPTLAGLYRTLLLKRAD